MNNNEIKLKRASKPPYRKYFFVLISTLLCVLSGCICSDIRESPLDSENQRKSEAIIREAAAEVLKKDPNELIDEDFTKFTEFTLGVVDHRYGGDIYLYKELYDIKLLEKFTSLRELNLLIRFPQKDIPYHTKILAKLGIFDFNEKYTIDLRPLEKLIHLQVLNLRGSHIKNIKPLASLTNLRTLSLDETLVCEIEPIKELTNLEALSIRRTQISNIEPIKELTNLEHLFLSGSRVSNLEPVKRLNNLRFLYLDKTAVRNLEPLTEIENLKWIGLYNCKNISSKQVEELQKTLPNLRINR